MTTSETGRSAGPSLPDGPRLPRFVQTIAWTSARHWVAPRWRRRYGDVFTIRIAQGKVSNVVVLCRPEHIREVFSGTPEGFYAGPAKAILRPVLGEHSVLLQDSEDHKRSRKRLMPAFSGATLRGYGAMMTALAAECALSLPIGTPFASYRHMNGVTLEIIMRVVFGVTDERRLAELRSLIPRLVNVGALSIMGWLYPGLRQYWPWRRNYRAQLAVDALIYEEIAVRRHAEDLLQRTDVLSRLLAAHPDVSDGELRDHMITLVLAGHETTAAALSWSLHELARNPAVLRAAQQAADRGDDEYLSAVAKEAMRLRPVLYQVVRWLTEDTVLAGWLLPAGTVVAAGIGLVHSDASVHPAPSDFQPERFIGQGPEAGTWIPFGGGSRRCIGASFSLQEAAAVLRAVLSRYDIAPDRVKLERARNRNIMLVPARGARVVLTRRDGR